MARPSPSIRHLTRVQDRGIEVCGRIAEFWGFTRVMGRTFGLLYLSQTPLSQTEIQKRLGVSAGNASMTLTALQRWGVAHKVWVKGQRREHYRSETDFWKMISGVLNERERREITAALTLLSEAQEDLTAARAATKPRTPGRAQVEFTRERLDRLDEICRLGEVMLDMLLGHMKLDVSRLKGALGG